MSPRKKLRLSIATHIIHEMRLCAFCLYKKWLHHQHMDGSYLFWTLEVWSDSTFEFHDIIISSHLVFSPWIIFVANWLAWFERVYHVVSSCIILSYKHSTCTCTVLDVVVAKLHIYLNFLFETILVRAYFMQFHVWYRYFSRPLDLLLSHEVFFFEFQHSKLNENGVRSRSFPPLSPSNMKILEVWESVIIVCTLF